GGAGSASAASACGALRGAVHRELDGDLAAQHRAGLGPGDQHPVLALGLHDTAGQELADDCAPFLLAELAADAPDTQLLVAGLAGALVLPSQQHFDDLPGAELLAPLTL